MAKTRTVENIPAAAALLKIDIELVKRAKRMGSPAFKLGNRIDVDELRKWIAENEGAIKASGEILSLKDQKLNEEIRKLRIANDQKERMTVSKEKGLGVIANIQARVRTFLEAKLENEYPSVVVGMNDIAQIRVYGRKVNDQILVHLQELGEEWKKI